MVSASKTRASGRMAVAGVGALWLAAGAAFVAPKGPVQERGLRGTGHQLEVRPFEAQAMGAQEAPQMSWTSVVSAAAAFGMVAALMTAPVRAEEAAAPAPVKKSAIETFKEESAKEEKARAAALTKEERVKKELESMKKETGALSPEFAANDAMESSPKARGGKKTKVTGQLIKKTKEEKAAAAPASAARKIISPADELDEDELSLSRSNPVALFLLATFAPATYLVFYVLGSLDII